MGRNVSTVVFTGVFCVVSGTAIIGALIQENWKVKWHAWDAGEQRGAWLGAIVVLVGLCLAVFGCGAREPEPTDPVTVEVSVCEPTLGGTLGQYYRLKIWRRGEGVCEAMLESSEERRRAICAVAEDDIDRLDRELDAYLASGRDDCYSGPVFNEMQDLVEEKRQAGTLCREP